MRRASKNQVIQKVSIPSGGAARKSNADHAENYPNNPTNLRNFSSNDS